MTSPFFTVLPGHDLAYNEVVKPNRRWAFSYYFLHRWLPLLHPQQAMLIQVLRQSTWQHGRPTGHCQLANATLCRLLGWAESSHKTLLAELERPLTGWFVRRERTRKRHVTEGHAVEGAPRYRVTMDEPLTPRDQRALHALLAQAEPATPYEAAECLKALAARRTRELWAMLDAQSVPDIPPERPATVAAIARAVWPHLAPAALDESRPFAETAEQCQLRLTGAGYAHMELDYLLRSWLPVIGVNNCWLAIVLRARCFHDPHIGETRDVITLSRRELEAQLGIPERTFRRLLRDEQTLDLFHISPAGKEADPTCPRELPQRGDVIFHVAYPLLPIAPADQKRYETLLFDRNHKVAETSFSTSGQTTRLEAARQPGWSLLDIHNQPANPAQGSQMTRLFDREAANEPISIRPTNPSEWEESGHTTPLDAAIEPNIQETLKSNELLTKRKESFPKTLGKGGERSEREEIIKVLEPFGIQGLARVLENPDLTLAEVRGWIYRGYEEVEAHQMGGYLFRRLCVDGETNQQAALPEIYRLVGAISKEEEEVFEGWWMDEQVAPPFSDQEQRARYGAWLKVKKREEGNPDRPDFSPHACWRREMARVRCGM
ncbi:MAG TPA: hypothetical protein VF707_10265 [Ardenticatenaceae bacterium]|jgi:hypothetical protein